MIIDIKDLILGRVATFVAKKALLEEKEINIINCDYAVVSGKKKDIIKRMSHKDDRGTPEKGPFMPKTTSLFVKRVIRGMLPYKKGRGREAFKKIKCYKRNPNDLKGESIEEAHLKRLKNAKYMYLKELCKALKK